MRATGIVTLCLTLAAGMGSAPAEMASVTIARQPSLGHLPLMIMQDRALLEARAAARGIDGLKVEYLTFAGGAAMNDALLSGSIQIAAGGVPPLLTLWSRTRGTSAEVKGIAAMNSMPLFLNTSNPDVRTIADFTDRDRIALPAVKVSIQAILLQMAAAKTFGGAETHRLDRLTVTMSHPDGMAALLAKQDVTAHFTAAPVQELELRTEGVRTILDSYEVMGGPSTFNVVWASTRFRDENPQIYAAFAEALGEAIEVIETDRNAAIETYLKLSVDASDRELVESILSDDRVTYTLTPKGVTAYADFMASTGLIDSAGNWKDVFFDTVHGLDGS